MYSNSGLEKEKICWSVYILAFKKGKQIDFRTYYEDLVLIFSRYKKKKLSINILETNLVGQVWREEKGRDFVLWLINKKIEIEA